VAVSDEGIRSVADEVWAMAKKFESLDPDVEGILKRCSTELHALAGRRARRRS
jgi:hypothetical protein